MKERKNVGIITFFKFYNYGSSLQAFSTVKILSRLGYDGSVIDINSGNKICKILMYIKYIIKSIRYPYLVKAMFQLKKANKIADNRISKETIRKFDEFTEKELNVKKYTYSRLSKVAKTEEYCRFIAGSDQIWSPQRAIIKKEYFLRFAPKAKRIAYAPSFGIDKIPEYNKKCIKKYINDFLNISVREEEGKKILKELINKDVPVVLDPTLLLDKEEWNSIINNESLEENQYIFCYFLSTPSNKAIEYIKEYLKENKCIIVYLMNNYKWNDIGEAKYYDGNPLDFVKGIKGAKMVFTDSFHSVAFSLNLNKSFYVFKRNYNHKFDQSSRITSILGKVKEEDRYISQEDIECKIEKINDFERINNILQEEREKSLKWLKDKLD